MNIAFDVSYIQNNRAGIGRHALQLLGSLVSNDSQNEYLLHGWSFGIDQATLTLLKRDNVRVSAAHIPGDVKRFYWNKLRFPPIEMLIGKCDVFHSADPFLPPTKSAKKVCTVHDLAYKKFPEMFEPHVPAWNEYVTRSVRSADAIVVPSEQTKLDLVEMMGADEKKTHVVQLPPNAAFTSSPKDEFDAKVRDKFGLKSKYILAVGTIEPRKNLSRFLKACELVRGRKVGEFDVVIAGKKGWMYEDFFHTIAGNKNVRVLDYLQEEELASLYRQALCFVYPSIYEGYGFPVLEAMASGVPIVTSNNSSLREIADGVALLIDPINTVEIADAIAMLVSDEVRRVEMRGRGLQVVQRFTAKSAAQKVLSLYESLVGQ